MLCPHLPVDTNMVCETTIGHISKLYYDFKKTFYTNKKAITMYFNFISSLIL